MAALLARFAAATLVAAMGVPSSTSSRTRHVEYPDLPAAIQARFAADGFSRTNFPSYLEAVDAETDRRIAEGEREHFIYYALQSMRFTHRDPIEPAVSARQFVQSLSPGDRARLLEDRDFVPSAGWPAAERARIHDAIAAMARIDTAASGSDLRLQYFKPLFAVDRDRASVDALYADYVRVVRFLYKKEFEFGGSAAAVAELYRTRPHSSDTQVEAGFAVYLGLGTLHALEPDRRISRILIVGPGLDVAPRTDLNDRVAPQTVQPFAVADALLALAMSSEASLKIVSVDVNPRVVQFANRAREAARLDLFTGINETSEQPFSEDYRTYLQTLGNAIGPRVSPPPAIASASRYRHSIDVRESVRRAMSAEQLNIITERLVDAPQFDLVVITNVLTYFDDRQLALALCNIAAMLAPGGYVLHNESRAGLVEIAASAHIPPVQMRTAVIAGATLSRRPDRDVEAPAAPSPLYDTIWLHQKTRS